MRILVPVLSHISILVRAYGLFKHVIGEAHERERESWTESGADLKYGANSGGKI